MGQPDKSSDRLRTIRRLAIVTTVGVCILVVAGGIVRLTGSGLGCDDWPNCNDERFIDVSSGHTAIEQLNRLLSAVIGIPTLLLAVLAFRTRRTPLADTGVWLPSLGVLVTVVANGIVGGIAVRTELHPMLIQSHFLLAMVSIACGLVVVARATPTLARGVRPEVARLVVALTVLTAAALVTGTVVTGTGPHAGDEDVRRFGFDISAVARMHSVTVIVALLVAVVLAWKIRAESTAQQRVGTLMSAWIFSGLLQGGIGYVQYFNGVPELLVGIHIAGATLLWVLTIMLFIRSRTTSVASSGSKISSGVLEAA